VSATPAPFRHLIPLPDLLRPGDRRRLERALFATARCPDEVTSCLCKTAYYREGRARIAAARASKRTGEEIVAYRCRYCSQWHIGHKRPDPT
jgi:hypothetical protein